MCFSLRINLVLKSRISRKGWLVPTSVFDCFLVIYIFLEMNVTTKVFFCIFLLLEFCTIVCKIRQMIKTNELFILIWVVWREIKNYNYGLKFVIGSQIVVNKCGTNIIAIQCCGKDIYTLFMISVNFDIKPLLFDINLKYAKI
jgi:hypothetical protein